MGQPKKPSHKGERKKEREGGKGGEGNLKKWLLVWSDSWGNTRLLYGEAW